ncbi:MAG: hypothetical protein ACI9CF_001061 [Candidatus Omnitrophota bacterium]|jgi:hypothetical protein
MSIIKSREIICSPFACSSFQGLERACNVKPFLDTLPKVNVQQLVFITLVQDGASSIEMQNAYRDEIDLGDYISGRIHFHEGPEWIECFMIVKSYFNIIRKDNPKLEENSQIEVFLIDILYAMQRGKSVVVSLGLDNVKRLIKDLTLEHRMPLENLLNVFQRETLGVIVPSSDVGTEQISIYQRIVEDRIFKNYVLTSKDLDTNDVNLADVVSNIIHLRRKIRDKYKFLQSAKKQVINVLPVAKKLLDIWSGSAATPLIEKIEEYIVNASNRNQRIVVYDGNGITDRIFSNRMLDKMRVSTAEADGKDCI